MERTDIDYFCRLVPNTEIAENDYNLSVSTYIEQEDTREVIDIKSQCRDQGNRCKGTSFEE